MDEYVAGRGPDSYDDVQDAGFSHGFGRLEANRELVEWMRQYNADPSHAVTLRFYGFDSPTEMMGTDSPRDCWSSSSTTWPRSTAPARRAWRERIEPLLGEEPAGRTPRR